MYKSRTSGTGKADVATARFATKKEIEETYVEVAYEPEKWRKGENLPTAQGLVLGSIEKAGKLYALVDTGDVHCLMIGAAGVGKTAHFLYPNIEYACACGMSFLTTDTKGDLYRNYAGIAKKHYGYQTAVILLIAEFCPKEKRHIISVFKLIQDLLAPSKVKGRNQFQLLMAKLPDTHKAKWFAGAALNTAEQSMQSVLSTALSRLNSFLDSELEQILCFDTAIDAEVLSKNLGNKTVMSGSISRGKNDPSQSLQMIQRPLMTPDELKSLPKGNFIVSKTGSHPMKTRLKLFLKWGITFEEPYEMEEKVARKVVYADKQEIEEEIIRRFMCCMEEEVENLGQNVAYRSGMMQQSDDRESIHKSRPSLRTKD